MSTTAYYCLAFLLSHTILVHRFLLIFVKVKESGRGGEVEALS
jgi:hypothetical protein